jgi:cytochrome b involved in lipid metabolism/protoporphyrinogen oxidase
MYDYFIVGGGIAGLYTTYHLSKNYPNKKICLIEGSKYIGGRLHSIKYDGIIVDGGGARFNTKQHRVVSLVNDLNLTNKVYPITNTINYKSVNPKYDIELETIFPSIDSFIVYLKKIIKKHNITDEELINTTLLDIVDYKLNKKSNLSKKSKDKKDIKLYTKYTSISQHYPTIKQYLIDIYPYYSELGVLNALEAINLFTNEFSDKMKYSCIDGGMEQLAELLYNKLKKQKNVKLYKECPLEKIMKINNNINNNIYYELSCNNDKQTFTTLNLILAIPKNKLIYIDYLKQNKKVLDNLKSIQNEPLYRIYARYPLNKSIKTQIDKNTDIEKEKDKVWFHDLKKTSTNLPIKYIIPINYKKGVIMISYTDSKFANYWTKQVVDKTFEKTLTKQLTQLFPNKTIPKPKWYKHCPWVSGAGYWKKGYDRKIILQEMIQPLENEPLYICGENYSSHQAWVEGALETAELVLKKLGITIIYKNKNNKKTIKKSIKIKKTIKINKILNSNKTKIKINKKKKKMNNNKTKKTKTKTKLKSKSKSKSKLKSKSKSKSKSKTNINYYTLTEVAKHNKKTDAWIVINNKVANITDWISKHPGGDIIMKGVGKDATKLFNSIGHSDYAKQMLKKYQIGKLKK